MTISAFSAGTGTCSRPYGFVEWFRPGEYERTSQTIADVGTSGASYLRTHLSWAEYLAPGGEAWFDWLIPKLGREIDLLPCIHYTPPSLSRTGRSSGAPADLKSYADFVDHVLTRYGRYFSHVELWNEPNNLLDWDWREDKDFLLFCEMVGAAAYWAKHRGWKPVLGGPCPFDPYWLNLMGERGVLGVVDAVGFHGFPGTWDSEEGTWSGWDMHLGEMRNIIGRFNDKAEIWITETGYSTWRNDEMEQARRFVKALSVPADRMYWYSWRDVPPDVPVQEGLWFDPRHYHLGAVTHENQPKLLARLLMEGGVERLEQVARLATPNVAKGAAPIVITGGCGFIGSNLADSYLQDGEDVVVLDNLGRPGVDQNLGWLTERHGSNVHPVLADVRDARSIEAAFADAKAVFHFAAQTAVTTSLIHPIDDFEANARGTINVLESVRKAGRRAPVIFASTNKVYGGLDDLAMREAEDRYLPVDATVRSYGIGEDRPLDFCTPYGCSKGVADQYVLDYAKSFSIPTAVLRMSCIYGPRQFGTEDQGWVAHFLIRALAGEPVSIYGDGKQVRDILHVADAVAAYRGVLDGIDGVKGRVFNLGGGPTNAVSVLAVLREIGKLIGRPVETSFDDWRPGDQYFFVADTRKLQHTLGWSARVGWESGLRHLAEWLIEHRFGGRPILRRDRKVSA
ncbi:NAD-dependent epimerase/dehydratase family protein [Rhizobium leguminosarum]|uniref:NAD-dependent epimerase/dehydratase n=1 Tax=Rhizobium leguminosarum bv. trifolii (strain WSM1325) TaxID=395491 RepID=C6B907_RHILS|nr:NAD-dependent epimerase/dehydratase family protein [Rhizobium leguminosarum]ACS60395.1 NAD-dependent epimerase/dehydratase [Rhizobium leguminosarum bv. trifolii WSM1325]MBY2911961.1 NAD-dependent epimerase/dehydratase family protein [Rhizobium leguminosarum]MBY2944503.1 NAD-dependent epimerase/dehydratase family protein [Rhizobium leguminosarum]MBY2988707.1 NAD-dependent epimerase/dehydratase family protein [Rhizobium leguminosarum]MBY3003265.1 NAD-dependent epimerase/dehydratase family pro